MIRMGNDRELRTYKSWRRIFLRNHWVELEKSDGMEILAKTNLGYLRRSNSKAELSAGSIKSSKKACTLHALHVRQTFTRRASQMH
jgi:hypothetical protein